MLPLELDWTDKDHEAQFKNKTEASSEIHYEKRSLRTVSGLVLRFEKFD